MDFELLFNAQPDRNPDFCSFLCCQCWSCSILSASPEKQPQMSNSSILALCYEVSSLFTKVFLHAYRFKRSMWRKETSWDGLRARLFWDFLLGIFVSIAWGIVNKNVEGVSIHFPLFFDSLLKIAHKFPHLSYNFSRIPKWSMNLIRSDKNSLLQHRKRPQERLRADRLQ